MTGVIIAIWPIALLIVLAIVGIPLWMTVRHRHAAPDHREARSHYRAKQATPAGQPISDFVPAEPGRGRGRAHDRPQDADRGRRRHGRPRAASLVGGGAAD